MAESFVLLKTVCEPSLMASGSDRLSTSPFMGERHSGPQVAKTENTHVPVWSTVKSRLAAIKRAWQTIANSGQNAEPSVS
jgi:hypothetical protein